MPNGTYGGVRGKETKVGQKTFVSRPTRLAPLSDVSECPFFSCNNLIFRMRAEWIPQGYGIRSARIRNMGAMWCGIPESVHTPCPLFLK